jgi:hypothetical protein
VGSNPESDPTNRGRTQHRGELMYETGRSGIQPSRFVRMVAFILLIMPTIAGGLFDVRFGFQEGVSYWGGALLLAAAASLLMIPAVLFLVPTYWLGTDVGIRKRLSLALAYFSFFYLVVGTSLVFSS